MIVDAHLDIGWNAIAGGRGFLADPAPGYVISRSALAGAGVGLVFATLYTAPARATRPMRTPVARQSMVIRSMGDAAQVSPAIGVERFVSGA